MYRKIPYSPQERQVLGRLPGMMGREGRPIYNTPVTPRANMDAALDDKHPYWMPYATDMLSPNTALYMDTLGRSIAKDMTDVFGIRWKYVPSAGGSITEAGEPLLADANDWREVIKLPDIDAWDWAGEAAKEKPNTVYPCCLKMVNGYWFERLISFMDFMGAAMALVDEDQYEAVRELFAAMTDLGCRLIDKFCQYFPHIDMFEIHDDWGSQKAPFFSMDIANDLFVPFMKQLTDRIHQWGRRAILHSCGHNAERIQCYIDGGFDYWSPQTMNDIGALYDQYGDKITLAVFPEETDLAQRSEEEQRAAARRFAERYCQPGKPAIVGLTALDRMTPAFEEELYIHSRKLYLEQA